MVRRNDKETTVRRLTVPMMLAALLMSACQIRTDIVIEINGDESGTIAFELGFDEELRQLAESEGGEFSFDGFDGLSEDVPAGWTVGDFDDGEFAGTRISTRFSSLDDLRTQLAALDSGSDDPTADFLDSVTVTRDGEMFHFAATLAQLDDTLQQAGDFDFGLDPAQFLGEIFQIRFIVTMPGEVTSHNADVIDGSTLVWEVPLDGRTRILEAVSGSSGGFPLFPLLAAVGGIALVAGLWLTIQRRRHQIDAVMYGDTAGHIVGVGETQPVGADPFAQ